MPRGKEKSAQARERAREAILAAAMAVFGEKGFEGATTAEVAASAKVSTGLVFNYFPTKDLLLQALIERWLKEAFGYWRSHVWAEKPSDCLEQIVDVVIARICADVPAHRLYLSLLVQPGRAKAVYAVAQALKEDVTAYYERIEQIFRDVGSDDPFLDTKLFQFALNGLVLTIASEPALLSRPDLLPLQKLKRKMLSQFLPSKPGNPQ